MVLQVNRCLSIKGAEDVVNKPFAFEVSTTDDSMFFIAETVKVVCLLIIFNRRAGILAWLTWQEKEDWINAVGRAIVRHSKR